MNDTISTIPPLPETLAFPPLPPIADAKLARQVVTHSSAIATPRHATSLDVTAQAPDDYEKLEHVGDGLLGGVVTTLLHDLYPQLPPGTATTLKAHLVNNALLAQLCIKYGIMDNLIAAPAALYTARMQTKVQASVFEAYIAGVFYDYLKSATPGAYEEEGSVGATIDGESVREVTESMAGDELEAPPAELENGNKTPGAPLRTPRASRPSSRAPSRTPSRVPSIANFNLAQEPVAESLYLPPPYLPLPELKPLHARTRGDAFDYIDRWLRPLFTPVAEFAMEHMRAADRQAGASTNGADDIDDPEVDKAAEGATGALNGWAQLHHRMMPQYVTTAEGLRWRADCVLEIAGVKHSAAAVRHTKKAAMTVAAWKVSKAVGII